MSHTIHCILPGELNVELHGRRVGVGEAIATVKAEHPALRVYKMSIHYDLVKGEPTDTTLYFDWKD